MAKYLLEASYSAEGLKGLQKDGGSARREAVARAISSVGDRDAIIIFEAPDNVAAAALTTGMSSTGAGHTTVTPLLTVEEVDQAVKKNLTYRPPGT
jgi:uncharacterized protein with GYD domain